MRKLPILFVFLFVAVSAFAQTLQEGLQFLQNENYKAAQAAFEKLIISAPQNADAYYYLGETFLEQGNTAGAKDAYTRGLTANKNGATNQLGLARLLLDEGKTQDAEKLISQAIRMTKAKDPEIYSRIAQIYMDSKKPNAAKAVENAKISRDLDPKRVNSLVLLGKAYQLSGDNGQAMSSYENASSKDPNNVEVLIRMAKIWSGSQPKLAIENLEKAIRLDTKNASAFRMLGDMYQRDKQYDKVPGMLDQYLALAGNDVMARFKLIRYLSTFPADNADRIIAEGATVVKGDPTLYYAHRYMSWAYTEKGQFQNSLDAVAAFDKAKLPEDSLYLQDYIYAFRNYAGLQQFDKANAAADLLVAKDPTRTDVFGTIAQMYYDAKDYPKAAEAYRNKIAKSATPEAGDYVQVGVCEYALKNWAKCDSAYAKVVEISPTYLYGWSMRAKCHENMDNEETPLFIAKPFHEKIIAMMEGDAKLKAEPRNLSYLTRAYNYLGYQAASLSDNATALTWFQKTLAIDPANADAVNVVAQLSGQ